MLLGTGLQALHERFMTKLEDAASFYDEFVCVSGRDHGARVQKRLEETGGLLDALWAEAERDGEFLSE